MDRMFSATRFLAIVVLALCAACSNGDGQESAGDKSEWATLQGLELESRGKTPPSSPELSVVRGYDMLAVASADGKTRIWIMLWPKSPPFYKQMPGGNFEISYELWIQLQREHKVSSTVANALRSHFSDPP